MTEREEEHPVIKVTDRRKFNLDGSAREGFEAAADPPKTEIPKAETAPPVPEEPKTLIDEPPAEPEMSAEEFDTDEIPGADDPSSFINFLSTLATNAAAALGAVPHPVTGQRSVDLDGGKYWLDVIGMIREKTKGNLHPQESRLLDGLLADLRMQYVQLVRATEERLKAQAAQKFSAQDILGKK